MPAFIIFHCLIRGYFRLLINLPLVTVHGIDKEINEEEVYMKYRPNVLFILSDQHNPKIIGCAGNNTINTPNLDRLAREGVIFDSCYCQNPLCVPSRSSLLTGQYSRSIGIYGNRHILEANCMTLPRKLGEAGYRTCLIGKAHFNGEQFHGYQQRPYGDIFGQGHQPDPRRLPEKGDSGLGDILGNSGKSGIPLPLTQTEICVAEAAKWLQVHVGLHREQPFFLCVNFDKPHFPINPPEKYYRKYEGKVRLPELPVNHEALRVPFVARCIAQNEQWYSRDSEVQLRALTAYYGCIEWVDDAVGRLMDTLEYLGLAEDTIMIYSSDHGEMAGEHGAWQKSLFFDASARVPLIVRWPGQIPGGRRCTCPVGLIDIFPTLCEAAQIDIPEKCEGESIMPLLKGDGVLERESIFSESVIINMPEHAGCMIRTDKWKYCRYLDKGEELYNMLDDPDEWNNLAGDNRYHDLKECLRKKVEEFWKPEEQIERYNKTPIMKREKHFYEYSNQFMLGDGTIADARP